jgi:EAL domain-containing protein (putative c-di-GMP-specific phosphodiesterase class I)
LKIDQVFIYRKREDNPEECVKIISAMTNMAHALDLAVIVEVWKPKNR